jgi:hypothetical protein
MPSRLTQQVNDFNAYAQKHLGHRVTGVSMRWNTDGVEGTPTGFHRDGHGVRAIHTLEGDGTLIARGPMPYAPDQFNSLPADFTPPQDSVFPAPPGKPILIFGMDNPLGNPALAPVHSAPDSLSRRLFVTYELGHN